MPTLGVLKLFVEGFVEANKLQFDAASPPNPLPHRGGGISHSYFLSFLLVLN